MNDPVGYKSKSYLKFLDAYISTLWAGRTLTYIVDRYDFAQYYLKDWDAEFISSLNCLRDIEDIGLHTPINQEPETLTKFKLDYPRSEFLPPLEKSLDYFQEFSPGNILPEEIQNRIRATKKTTAKINDFALSVLKSYSPKWLDSDIPETVKHFVLIHESLLQTDSLSETIKTNIQESGKITLGISSELMTVCEPILNKTLFFDNKYRITGYCDVRFEGGLSSFYSWPEEKVKRRKQVSMKFAFIIAGSLIILSVLIIVLIRLLSIRRERKAKYERKIHELELKALRARMNPHFLFNALSSIQSLINQGKLKSANDFLANFGDLVRQYLNQSNQRYILLKEELDVLRNYVDLELLRFDFDFTIELSEDIDIHTIEIPPLLIQPHLENAIIHGIGPLKRGGEIVVSFVLDDDCLVIKVSDNGLGFDSKGSLQPGNGKGWELTCQRIDFLKKETGRPFSVRKLDKLKDNRGAQVEFRIPIEKE